MRTMKDRLIDLLDKLNEKQLEYLYYLVKNLFSQASD